MIAAMSYLAPWLPSQLDGVLSQVGEQPVVWVRIAAVRDERGEWRDRLIELTSGAAPPGWEPRRWEYPSTLLLSVTSSGTDVADALRVGSLVVDEDSIAIRD